MNDEMAWPEADFVRQPVGHLPWGHNLVLLTKRKGRGERLAYAAAAIEHGWSRAVLVHHILDPPGREFEGGFSVPFAPSR